MFDGTPFEGIEARDCVALLWAARRPLADQWERIWGRLPDRESNMAMAWWIARAGQDAWTFEQLAEWALARIGAGEPLPPLLWEFMAAGVRGAHTKPKDRKNAACPRRDLMAWLAVHRLKNAFDPPSQNKARDLLADVDGKYADGWPGGRLGWPGSRGGVEDMMGRVEARFSSV